MPRQHRDDEAAGIPPGRQQLRDEADYQPEQYPRKNSHAEPSWSGVRCKRGTTRRTDESEAVELTAAVRRRERRRELRREPACRGADAPGVQRRYARAGAPDAAAPARWPRWAAARRDGAGAGSGLDFAACQAVAEERDHRAGAGEEDAGGVVTGDQQDRPEQPGSGSGAPEGQHRGDGQVRGGAKQPGARRRPSGTGGAWRRGKLTHHGRAEPRRRQRRCAGSTGSAPSTGN